MPNARANRAASVTVTSAAAGAVKRGHPWIWREAVTHATKGLPAGQVVEIRGAEEGPIGLGLWDPDSPIAARVYTRDTSSRLDEAWLAARIEEAIARRERALLGEGTSAYRLCHGEGDRVPGLVLDRYAWVVVARVDGAAMAAWLDRIAPAVWPALQSRGVRSLVRRTAGEVGGGRPGEGTRVEPLLGEPPPATIEVSENGAAMVVDLARGQKTGAFLDQRDNRARVRHMARGRRVLNLFSYAGGFSTSAALGGASRVTSVDIAQPAHLTAQQSMRANGLDPTRHDFVTADVFAFLAGAAGRRETWDLVISDPPSFAPNQKSRTRALAAYRKLHRACAGALAPGGILCASSCSSHVTAEEFVATLDDGSLERTDLALVGLFGPPWDHPTLPAWPEGRYLKFAVLA
jgi:23S rRNA (cytosine1962-C5)-methyltransferase